MEEKRTTGWTLWRGDGTTEVLDGPLALALRVLAGRAERSDLIHRGGEDWETLESIEELKPCFEAVIGARSQPPPLVDVAAPVEAPIDEPPETEEGPEPPADFYVPLDEGRLDAKTPVPPLPQRRASPVVIATLALCAALGGGIAGRRATALGAMPRLPVRAPVPTDPVRPLVARAMELRDEGLAGARAFARDDLAEALRFRPGDSRALGALAWLEAEDALRAMDEARAHEELATERPEAVVDLSLWTAAAWDEARARLADARAHAEAALRDPAADGHSWLALGFVRALEGRTSETTTALILAGDGPESDFVRRVLAEGTRGTDGRSP